MTRVVGLCVNQVETRSWIKTNQEQIERHRAWRGHMDIVKAEALLNGRDTFSYVLRRGEEENEYYISFVNGDGGVKHQRFILEYDRKGWWYKNGTEHEPTEAVDELIPCMMHCSIENCKPTSI